ncbi:MAG: hypothetical protein JWQ25_2331 [Daejeonella sp.]|nr:hypothetical protein [Daejeonella sp.]
MSKLDKLIARFLTQPKDLTWDELIQILSYYGYTELAMGKTGGSRRKFCNAENVVISLHEPHPKPVVKGYVIDQLIDHLKEKGNIK